MAASERTAAGLSQSNTLSISSPSSRLRSCCHQAELNSDVTPGGVRRVPASASSCRLKWCSPALIHIHAHINTHWAAFHSAHLHTALASRTRSGHYSSHFLNVCLSRCCFCPRFRARAQGPGQGLELRTTCVQALLFTPVLGASATQQTRPLSLPDRTSAGRRRFNCRTVSGCFILLFYRRSVPLLFLCQGPLSCPSCSCL